MSELHKALLKFQKDAPSITKDASNPFFNNKPYASLDSIMGTVRPALNKLGLVVTQHPSMDEDHTMRVVVTTCITHAETGEGITAQAACVLAAAEPQKVGAAITYLRRYGLASVLGLCTEPDDDANSTNATEQYHAQAGAPGSIADRAQASTPAAEERTQAHRAHENRIAIGNMLMQMNNNDAGDAADHLEVLTEWEKDGKQFAGKRSVKDISDKATYPVLLRTEEALKAWKHANDDYKAPADGIGTVAPAKEEQDDVPF